MTHPRYFVVKLLTDHPEVEGLEFGLYTYTPQTVSDQRRFLTCSVSQWLLQEDNWPASLGPHEELALHSRVRLGAENELAHIPLIDFRGELSSGHFRRVTELARDFGCDEVAFFKSGRSFHAYLNAVLKPTLWYQFIGRLLLLNGPNEPEWVDTRWLGHGLVAGFSALRWTHNTPTYMQLPSLEASVRWDSISLV